MEVEVLLAGREGETEAGLADPVDLVRGEAELRRDGIGERPLEAAPGGRVAVRSRPTRNPPARRRSNQGKKAGLSVLMVRRPGFLRASPRLAAWQASLTLVGRGAPLAAGLGFVLRQAGDGTAEQGQAGRCRAQYARYVR